VGNCLPTLHEETGMNIANMMKQAQQMQKRLQDAQAELADTEVSGEAGSGAVKVICDGQ